MHTRHRLRLSIPLLLIVLASGSLSAQQLLNPFSSNEGLAAAQQKAQTELGQNAVLYLVATAGNFEYQGQRAEFDPQTGTSTGWGYSFYSPTSSQTRTYGVIKLPILGFYAATLDSNNTLPTPPNTLETGATWFGSGAMVAQLKAQETSYTNFLQSYPSARPTVVTLGQILGDSIPQPEGVALDQPIWTVFFRDEGNGSLVCFVASKTGETDCQTLQGPVGAVAERGTARTGSIRVVALQGSDRMLLELAPPEGGTTENFHAALVGMDGRTVADLTEAFAGGSGRTAILETGKFSSGKYLIVVTAGNWRAVAGVVVYGS